MVYGKAKHWRTPPEIPRRSRAIDTGWLVCRTSGESIMIVLHRPNIMIDHIYYIIV